MTDPIPAELSYLAFNVIISYNTSAIDLNTEANTTNKPILAVNSNKSALITPEDLSKLWGIGLKTARRTLKSTSHQCIRTTCLLTKMFKRIEPS